LPPKGAYPIAKPKASTHTDLQVEHPTPTGRDKKGQYHMRGIRQRGWIAGLGLAWLTSLTLSSAHAQSYPQRPIKAIVPYAAGGFSDQASRIIAEAMSRNLGQNIVIENRAGGGGRIGSEAITKMPADG
jgi:hypothetical protein